MTQPADYSGLLVGVGVVLHICGLSCCSERTHTLPFRLLSDFLLTVCCLLRQLNPDSSSSEAALLQVRPTRLP